MHVRTIINIQRVGDTANFKDPNVRKSKHKDAPTTIFFYSTGFVSRVLHLMWIDSMISELTEHVSHIIPGYNENWFANSNCKSHTEYGKAT